MSPLQPVEPQPFEEAADARTDAPAGTEATPSGGFNVGQLASSSNETSLHHSSGGIADSKSATGSGSGPPGEGSAHHVQGGPDLLSNTSLGTPPSRSAESEEDDDHGTSGEPGSPAPPAPLPKDEKYLTKSSENLLLTQREDDNVAASRWTGRRENSPSQPQSTLDLDFDEKPRGDVFEESRPEIQTIMEQFKSHAGSAAIETSSPTENTLPVFHYPPRSSSLEHLAQQQSEGGHVDATSTSPTSTVQSTGNDVDRDSISFSKQPSIASQPPPPAPDPEPALPFDFHRFLEQLRHRTADPVAKFLRSFLLEFGKRQWQVHEQVKLISDFLAFIANRMAHCEVWRVISDAEFDNAREGMEKLVMNRLYSQTFSPEIPPGEASPSRNRRRAAHAVPSGSGRKGQHQEDVERDEVLAQKVRIYGWIKEEHLDIRPADDKGRKFLKLAQQELSKIKTYRAPRDKVICVLNCCKILFGFLRNSQSDQSADAFIPLLIYTVLKANPDHLVSNVQYILRFRNQEKLTGEAGYYMSSLMGAVQFIENLDRTNLTISDEEFEKNVEAAVSVIAERHEEDEKRQASSHFPFTEKSAPSRPEVTPRHSQEGERSGSRRFNRLEATNVENGDDQAAVSGLLRTIQKPLSSIGRIFSEDAAAAHAAEGSPPGPGSRPDVRRTTPDQTGSATAPSTQSQLSASTEAVAPQSLQGGRLLVSDNVTAKQESAGAAEAQRIQRREHQNVVETLSGMFPDLDREVIGDVVRVKEGRIGLAVDACLALSR